jgi:hypothetical protein
VIDPWLGMAKMCRLPEEWFTGRGANDERRGAFPLPVVLLVAVAEAEAGQERDDLEPMLGFSKIFSQKYLAKKWRVCSSYS